jgi:hypothetical protein
MDIQVGKLKKFKKMCGFFDIFPEEFHGLPHYNKIKLSID